MYILICLTIRNAIRPLTSPTTFNGGFSLGITPAIMKVKNIIIGRTCEMFIRGSEHVKLNYINIGAKTNDYHVI